MFRRKLAYIGDVSAVTCCSCSSEAGGNAAGSSGATSVRCELLISGSGSWVHITNVTSQQELWSSPVLASSRVHGVHSCSWSAAGPSSTPLLVLAVWGSCELVVVSLQLSTAAAPRGGSSISIRCLHQQRLPRTSCWVLDALLLAAPQPAAGASAPAAKEQQQQQQHVAASADLQLIALSMDNTCAVWSLKLGQQQQQQQQQWRAVCAAVVACDSRACLYSGALLHHQPSEQQPPVVWVASGTAFGDTLLWRLPARALTTAAAPPPPPPPQVPSTAHSSCHGVARVSYQLRGHEGSVHRVVWGPAVESTSAGDGQRQLLGTCSDDRSVRVWQVPLRTDQQQQQQQQPVAVDLEPTAILWGHTARVWDLVFLGQQQQQQLQRQQHGEGQPPGSGGSSSSTRRLIATSGEDCCCRLWDVNTRSQLAVLQSMGRAWRCCFLPASCQLAAATADGSLRVWSLQQWLGSSWQQSTQQHEPGSNRQQQQQQHCLVRQFFVPAACCRPGFQPLLTSEEAAASRPPSSCSMQEENKPDAVQAICMPHPHWLLVATKSGRVHAVDLLAVRSSSSGSRSSSSSSVPPQHAHPTPAVTAAAATPPKWYQLYHCHAGGPFLCMQILPGCPDAAAPGWQQCRVALGHRAGLAAVLDVHLPPIHPAESHAAAARSRSGAAAGSQSCCPPGPTCTAAVLWQAHAPHELVHAVFAPDALGCRGLITTASPTAFGSKSKDASGQCSGNSSASSNSASSSSSSTSSHPVVRVWLLPPPAGASSSNGPDKQQQQQQQKQQGNVECGRGSNVNSISSSCTATPLLLAEACMPARRLNATAVDVVLLHQAAGTAAAAALLVLGDDAGGVSVFRLPLWCLAAATQVSGPSITSGSWQRQRPVQQLELLQRFNAVHGQFQVTFVQASSSSGGGSAGGGRGQQAMVVAGAGAAAEWVTAGRDGNTARFLACSLDDAGAGVQVAMAAVERLPSAIMVVEHMVSVAAGPAGSGTSSTNGSTRLGQKTLLLGFKGSDVVAWDTAAAAPLWVLDCGGMRRARCFWHDGAGSRRASCSSSVRGPASPAEVAAADRVLLQFAYNTVGGIAVVQCAESSAGSGDSSAVLAPECGRRRVSSLPGIGDSSSGGAPAAPACRQASSSAVLSGHHSREVLAAVLIAGPAACASSSSGAAAAASVLLTGAEDGTVRATVIQHRQTQPQEHDDGGECPQLQIHMLGAHASGAAVRCLAAFRMPPSQLQLQPAASSWLVVAGCTQEVMLAWQVAWVVASEGSGTAASAAATEAAAATPQLTWQLVGSLAPLQNSRRKKGSGKWAAYKAAVEARCLALSIVEVRGVPVAGHHQAGAAAVGIVATVAVSLSSGSVQLLTLALPHSRWSRLAVLEPGAGPRSSLSSGCFAHPVLSMACLQLPAAGFGITACGQTCCCLLAAGTSNGSVLLYDASEHGSYQVATASAAHREAARLQPLLSLPGLHQAGVNSVLLLRLDTAGAAAAGGGGGATTEAEAAAAAAEQGQVVTLMLVTAGDDQALAATQLVLTATCTPTKEPARAGQVLQLQQQGGSARVDNAHASSLRSVVEVGAPARGSRCALRVMTAGLDQRCSFWDVDGLPPRSSCDDASGSGAGGAATCVHQPAPSVRHVCSWLTAVPEPAAASLLALPLGKDTALAGAEQQTHVLAICGRGLELETIVA